MADQTMWQYFQGDGKSHPLTEPPQAPEWRKFMADELFDQAVSKQRWEQIRELAQEDRRGMERGSSFYLAETEEYIKVRNAVNAAIYLRRPLLVTGKPGSGKTSLAYAIAKELQLGKVLTWAINTRSTLKEALYQYDAVARLQDAQLKKEEEERKPVGEYITLGPLGTAFLPSHLPRVLLIDEIDKSDINLPNDLLNLFEEGSYPIPELIRVKTETDEVEVRTSDRDLPAMIKGGEVLCREFPIVIMTSNGERDFPPAFLRRCIRLQMPDPTRDPRILANIVEGHLNNGIDEATWEQVKADADQLIAAFCNKSEEKPANVATDQLLNVVYLLTREVKPNDEKERKALQELLLKGLNEED